jgi:diaminohydroxyphosphoribosylaminopyrimidine deaminase/5-amino-6-(5-phosphoribosylamino)uracil reductase
VSGEYEDSMFMRRCFDLARQAAGHTSPNPMVGAVIVHDHRIIGEGFHEKHGGPHAEINAIESVSTRDRTLLQTSALYCSLEPCCHHGKTPPCTDRVLKEGVAEIIISVRDPSPQVSGQGVERLTAGGIPVRESILQTEGEELIRDFAVHVRSNRPFITLKFAQSADGFMSLPGENTQISHRYTRYHVHKWRGHHDAIMVGTDTVLIDNPSLTNRFFYGPNPIRIVPDRNSRVPSTHRIFTDANPVLLISSSLRKDLPDTVRQLQTDDFRVENLMDLAFGAGIRKVFVEGGPRLLQSFLDVRLWDDLIVITSDHKLGSGLKSPKFDGSLIDEHRVASDRLRLYRR